MYIWVASILVLVHVLDKQSLCLCICVMHIMYVPLNFMEKNHIWSRCVDLCRQPATVKWKVGDLIARGGSRTNLGPALETGQPWPPPSIGHPPVSSPRPPSPSFFSKRSALFPSDCVHGDHLWSPRGLFSVALTGQKLFHGSRNSLTPTNPQGRPAGVLIAVPWNGPPALNPAKTISQADLRALDALTKIFGQGSQELLFHKHDCFALENLQPRKIGTQSGVCC